MRAPFQEGDFPGPVKYGYLNVGVVERGPDELRGRTVFCLYPHQTAYVVPADAVTVVPDDVPPARAVLAGTVETAVNALWDAAPLVGDRITVVGAGMVGCCVARLLAGVPGTQVTLVDVDPARGARRGRARRRLRAARATPPAGGTSSCTPARRRPGCSCRSTCSRPRATVIDLSWYGDSRVAAVARRRLPLAAARHPRQPGRRGRAAPAADGARTADRLALALDLLRDPAFDALLTGAVAVRRAARRDGRGWPTAGCRRSATRSPTTQG